MAHPRMYSEDDPYLAEVRKLCLALPESVEMEAWGRPTFRAGKKMFAWQEVAELMETSYRQVAVRRMLTALDQQA
jgi:hypothetical protein